MGASRHFISQRSIRFGPFELLPLSGELRKNGQRLKISGQPLEILLILIVRAGDIVARDELRDSLWSSNTFVDFEHSLNVAVKRLRMALEDDVSAPQYIETVPRRGYRFIGQVVEDEAKPEPGSEHADIAPDDTANGLSEAQEARSMRSVLVTVAIALLSFVAGLLSARMIWIR